MMKVMAASEIVGRWRLAARQKKEKKSMAALARNQYR